jgi:hypothetical protein
MGEEIKKLFEKFEKEKREELEEKLKEFSEFLKKFPFRDHPEEIDKLTEDKIYEKKNKTTFLHQIKYGLNILGRVRTYGDKDVNNARNNIEEFKKLLKLALSNSSTLSEKIDLPWENIPRWGGEINYWLKK